MKPTTSIHFGAMSLILAFGVLQGVIVMLLLILAKRNRTANRLLAALLAVSVLRLLPYVAGYAGFYDAYPWLSFAPWNLSFAFGPLIFLFVARLTCSSFSRRWFLHLTPAATQFVYYAWLFCHATPFKNDWDRAVQRPWVVGPQFWLTLLSAAMYLLLARRRLDSYQEWLSNYVSFADDLRMPWLRRFLVASGIIIAVWFSFGVIDLFHPLNYFAEFPLYVGFTAFVYFLGLEGWRHAGDSYPHPSPEPAISSGPIVPAESGLLSEPEESESSRWQVQGAAWLAEIKRRELWQDADLSAAVLARELGTNTTYLSKALNDGLGQSFSECINRQRVQAVEETLRKGATQSDLLNIALRAGFKSKASFNRAFKAYTGETPSQYRTNLGRPASQIVNP